MLFSKRKSNTEEQTKLEDIIVFLGIERGKPIKNTKPHIPRLRKLITAIDADFDDPYQTVKEVITHKCNQWKGTKWKTYLRPRTLFDIEKFYTYEDELGWGDSDQLTQDGKEFDINNMEWE